MTKNKTRSTYVDIAKGICILLVARGHLNYNFLPDWANEHEFYTIWYVSAFMIIAGFFLKDADMYSPMSTIKKKGRVLYLKSLYFFLPATLLHNWFVSNGLLASTQGFYESGKDWAIAIGKVFCGLSFEKMVEPLWFAVTLFWGFLFLSLFLCIMRIQKWDNWKYETICLLCTTSAICYINNYTNLHIPNRLGGVLRACS